MTPRLKSTRAARDLIKAHEPFLAEAERRGKRWVVGYGHTASAKEGVSLKAEDAELLLIYDVMRAEQTIDASVGAEMAAPMRDALVSFALSVGLRAFKVSDVARLARAGRHLDAAAAIETWVRADEDGRLVVSDRLVTRRAAEKALYLSALEDSAARVVAPSVAVEPASESAPETEAEPEPEPEAESEPEPEPETIAVTDASADLVSEAAPDQAQADTQVDAEVQAEAVAEPEAAGLIELDIAFETPDERAAESALPPQEHEASPEVALAPVQQEDREEGEADAEPEHAETDASDVEADDTPASEAPVAAPDSETDSETPESQAELDEMKAAQDASIAAVMARMAQQVSASIAPAAEHEAPVKLGYSFLSTAHVDMASQGVSRDVAEPVEPAPAPQPQPAQPKSLFSSPSVPMSPFQGALQVSSIKMTPIAPEALPQGSAEDAGKTVEDTDSVKAVADVSDRDDSLSVKIPSDTEAAPEAMTAAQTPRQDAPVFSAPPHPALAPASAPGLSGDVEGPDHPDKDDEDSHHDLHEDSEDLDPTVVGGSQTPVISSSEPAQPKGGDLMFISSLAVGGAMVGLGGWDIAANMDAYMELGLSYSPLGPIVFGAGVLLSAASVWFIIGRRNEK